MIAKGLIPAEWQLITIINCYKGKGDASETGKQRGLKLTADFEYSWVFISKLIRQLGDAVWFHFINSMS